MSHDNTYWEVGDILISTLGKMPFRITSRQSKTGSWGKVYGRYLHNNSSCSFYRNNVQYYEEQTTMAQTLNTLYTFTDGGSTLYGTEIGRNSSGQVVVEVKGTGNVVLKKPEELTEVLPYTFSILVNNSLLHFTTEEGKIEKGDFLLYAPEGKTASLVVVEAVDTKSKSAKTPFPGKKLVAEAI